MTTEVEARLASYEKIFDEVRDLLNRRLGDFGCLRCKHTAFVLDLEDSDAARRVGWPTGLKAGSTDVSLATITCQNCGFVEHHNIAYLSQRMGASDG